MCGRSTIELKDIYPMMIKNRRDSTSIYYRIESYLLQEALRFLHTCRSTIELKVFFTYLSIASAMSIRRSTIELKGTLSNAIAIINFVEGRSTIELKERCG